MTVLRHLEEELGMTSTPSKEYLDEKCNGTSVNNRYVEDCKRLWEQRRAEYEAKRRSEVATQEEARAVEMAAYRERQEQKLRETQEREMAAQQADERAGYKSLTFEDFALDANKMQGAKIALSGFYVDKGQRLAANQLAALFWIERSQSPKGALIPLITSDAARDSRAMLLRCAESPIGCAVVVRGRVRMLTLRNAFGAESRELGMVVESVR